MLGIWTGLGIGFTVYCFVTGAPLWLHVLNIVVDVSNVIAVLSKKD